MYGSAYQSNVRVNVFVGAMRSNCQKRAVVCVLYDNKDNIVSVGYNECTPPNGQCSRLHTVQTKSGYSNAGCNSTHAEANALRLLMRGRSAKRAEVYGHEFACPACEKLLHEYGITDIKIIPESFGAGLRKQ